MGSADPGGRHVSHRLALLFPGFEPLSAMSQARRFLSDLASVAPLYGMAVVATQPVTVSAGAGLDAVEFTVTAGGAGWSTRTDMVVYGLGALNAVYARRSPLMRAASGYRALARLALNGALGRYLRTSWRFGLFFFPYPVVIAVFAPVAAWVLLAVADDGVSGAALALSITVAAAILAAAVRHLHLMLALDLWSYTRDVAERRNPEIEALRAAAVEDAARRVARAGPSEALFCGHSMGAVIAASAADAAARLPDRPLLGVLTVGSSLQQVGFDPAAAWLRDAVGGLVRAGIDWIDVQSMTDIVNFHRADPSRDLANLANPRQRVVPVRFRLQLTPSTYRAMKTDLFRMHRQFVRAVERRSHYSWHAIICGPEPFSEVRERGGLAPDWKGG